MQSITINYKWHSQEARPALGSERQCIKWASVKNLWASQRQLEGIQEQEPEDSMGKCGIDFRINTEASPAQGDRLLCILAGTGVPGRKQ